MEERLDAMQVDAIRNGFRHIGEPQLVHMMMGEF